MLSRKAPRMSVAGDVRAQKEAWVAGQQAEERWAVGAGCVLSLEQGSP